MIQQFHSAYIFKGNEIIRLKYLHFYDHYFVIHNSKGMETTCASIDGSLNKEDMIMLSEISLTMKEILPGLTYMWNKN